MLSEALSAVRYEVIKDPIYGYMRLYEHEKNIVDTAFFQRLRRIRQLYAGHFVYPGATHTRFSHSLGVMHLSGLFVKQLLEPYQERISSDTFLHYFFLMRLWGLTHDLGHGPFCHAFDEAILQEQQISHEYMASKIVQEDESIGDVIDKLGVFSIDRKVLGEYLGKSTREEWTNVKKLGTTEHTDMAFYYLLRGVYSVDIIDYLLRDNYYAGAGYGNFDWQRLILYSHLWKNEMALDRKARDALDALLLSRFFSFDTIYYHRWSRAVDHIVKLFLLKAKEKIDFSSLTHDLKQYEALDEESIFHMKELACIPECEMLRNRRIPFRKIDEVVWRLDVNFPLTGEDLDRKLSEKLSDVPPEAYFVDTPNLHLNPMLGEDMVCVLDTSEGVPIESHESVKKTAWGDMPNFLWNVRLYLHNDYKQSEDKVKKAFKSVMKIGSRPQSYY